MPILRDLFQNIQGERLLPHNMDQPTHGGGVEGGRQVPLHSHGQGCRGGGVLGCGVSDCAGRFLGLYVCRTIAAYPLTCS